MRIGCFLEDFCILVPYALMAIFSSCFIMPAANSSTIVAHLEIHSDSLVWKFNRCEIETDVGSSTNPPEALSRVSSLNPHSDLKQIKISMDGEVKPQVSMTRSHCEGKTSEIDLPQIPKGERTNSENQREGQRRGLPFEVVKVCKFSLQNP